MSEYFHHDGSRNSNQILLWNIHFESKSIGIHFDFWSILIYFDIALTPCYNMCFFQEKSSKRLGASPGPSRSPSRYSPTCRWKPWHKQHKQHIRILRIWKKSRRQNFEVSFDCSQFPAPNLSQDIQTTRAIRESLFFPIELLHPHPFC